MKKSDKILHFRHNFGGEGKEIVVSCQYIHPVCIRRLCDCIVYIAFTLVPNNWQFVVFCRCQKPKIEVSFCNSRNYACPACFSAIFPYFVVSFWFLSYLLTNSVDLHTKMSLKSLISALVTNMISCSNKI